MTIQELAREYGARLAHVEFVKKADYWDRPYSRWDSLSDRMSDRWENQDDMMDVLHPHRHLTDAALRQPVQHDPSKGALGGGLLGLLAGGSLGAAHSPSGALIGGLGGGLLGGLAGYALHPKGLNRGETISRRQELVKRLAQQTAAKQHGVDLDLNDLNK